MSKREYSLRVRCKESGCLEYLNYLYTTRKDYNEGYKRNKNWKCTRHSSPDKVLSVDNKLICTELTNSKNKTGDRLYWSEDGKNLLSGFQCGVGFKAWSTDFPEGTILKVTAEIILP